MVRNILFQIKQQLKMALQNGVLPCVYGFWRIVYAGRKPELIILADAHHDSMPFSMETVREELIRRGYPFVEVIHDYAKMSQLRSAWHAIKFMRLYAQAKYVFICDNFLPVASCVKRKETTVVQLLHSSGLIKKMGYDTTEDIPANYRGNVYRNYDLVTVSAPCCIAPLTKAMGQPDGVVKDLGTSRTDRYFDREWINGCRTSFYRKYPEAKGKKVILWAPTFRGNAGDPYQVGMEEITKLEEMLGDDILLLRKVHPHVDTKYHLSNCDIPTERLLPVADLMISDYSSTVIDYLFFDKPYVLFAPDLEEFEEKRGFYVPYGSLTPYVATQTAQLWEMVTAALAEEDSSWIAQKRAYHLASCDGRSTARILDFLGL